LVSHDEIARVKKGDLELVWRERDDSWKIWR
jgi:hypothetical protein